MAMDFPSSPTVGQIFTDLTTGVQYQWTGTVWNQIVAANVLATAETRNRVVNPSMQVNQENPGASTTVNGGFPVDQWKLLWTGMTGCAAIQLANTSPNYSPYVINTVITTAKPSLAAGDYWMIRQDIEGNRIADLQWGAAGARQVILRFNFFATAAGTYGVRLANGTAGTRSWVGSFVAPAGAWVSPTLVIPGDTTGVWAKDNTSGIALDFVLACGTTYTAPAAGWNAGAYFAPPGMSNGAATANNSILIADVGLYADPNGTGKAPPFQVPDYAAELAACLRYYYKTADNNSYIYAGYANGAGVGIYGHNTHPAKMRINPAIAFTGVGYGNASGITTGSISTDGFRGNVLGTAIGAAYGTYGYTANARM